MCKRRKRRVESQDSSITKQSRSVIPPIISNRLAVK